MLLAGQLPICIATPLTRLWGFLIPTDLSALVLRGKHDGTE